MRTGRRAFEGESKTAALEAVLRKEPAPLRQLAPGVPIELEQVAMRCLKKDPLSRFQQMEDLAVVMQGLRDAAGSGSAAADPVRRERKWRWAAAVVAAVAVAVLLIGWRYRRPPKFGEIKLEKITNDAGLTADPALSPNGKLLAYASDRDGQGDLELWVQQVAGGDPVRLTDNDVDDRSPVFSPDSTHIAYRSERAGGGIYIISALGGKERLLVAEGRGPQFSPDGKQMAFWIGSANPGDILAPSAGKVYVMGLADGSSRLLRPDFVVSRQPIWSSSGSSLLFVGYPADVSNPSAAFDWWVVPRDVGPPVRTGALQAPELAAAGQVVSRAKLEAVPFAWRDDRVFFTGYDGDARSLWRAVLRQSDPKFAGPPERLTHSTGDQYGTSFDGQRLAFSAGEGRNAIWILPADTVSGRVTGPVKQIIEHGNYLATPSMSLDGGLLAYGSGSDRNLNIDMFLKRLGTGETVTLASTPDTEAWPRVLPDGTAIFYERRRFHPAFERMVFRVSPAGGDNRKICDNCGAWAVSPDGEWLVSKIMGRTFTEQTVYQVSTQQRSELLRKDKAGIFQPHFSNDGRWLVFMAREGPERARLYLTRFKGLRPIPDSEWAPITPDNWKVDVPRWSPDDRIIYFTAEPDGYRCIYAQRINGQTKAPEGEAYAVYHSHNARRSLLNAQPSTMEISVGRNGIAFLMGEITGNAWLATLPQK
jgi:Tol biopolymer transport system component